ncbi:hypothetical protein EIC82_03880 [Enterobacter sp. A11]|uniref:MucR family transcriptional regulator n=1 Tax=unclassified Enterobacter TaxID=2608935 RepID=UPI00106F0EC4|nr:MULTISPECIES: MucR family transcriptional regulator [unclassified Enterobacter]MBM1020213.1 MucR family transcriptional regulator [Enterobacter sp. E1]MEA3561514.1 MucR family transcriptional regulator [Enterobacter sp. GM-22]MEA3595190.1 MucR family transcriptional regulator [Enterobacter sp. GM-31]TFF60327.1 hypothetical protein EIC82_03880 [Enterobacter sp. A11]
MAADIQEDWLAILPRQLQPDAIALVRYLKGIPAMKPVGCPWCDSLNITGYPSDPRMYHCRDCDRRFTAWTGTPFANCRHQERWTLYARARLSGLRQHQVGQLTGLSHGACEYRQAVIETLIAERWPPLMPWWLGQISRDRAKPAPLRTGPFISKEEVWAHHNHEYVQCLECGKIYSSLNRHLNHAHSMSTMEYREKWQIMKQIPLAGFANRRSHSDSINEKIRNGDVDPLALAAAMQEANRLNGRAKPFNPEYIGRMHGDRLKAQKLWEQSPAIKTTDSAIRERALRRARQRHDTGEKMKDIAREAGVVVQTLYIWLKRWPEPP